MQPKEKINFTASYQVFCLVPEVYFELLLRKMLPKNSLSEGEPLKTPEKLSPDLLPDSQRIEDCKTYQFPSVLDSYILNPMLFQTEGLTEKSLPYQSAGILDVSYHNKLANSLEPSYCSEKQRLSYSMNQPIVEKGDISFCSPSKLRTNQTLLASFLSFVGIKELQ